MLSCLNILFLFSIFAAAASLRTVSQNQPTISVSPAVSVGSDDGWLGGWNTWGESETIVSPVMVRVDTPDHLTREPVDLVCIVDISGSMADLAISDADSGKKQDDLSILDLTKHAVKVVANLLNSDDRLSIVAFDDRAEVVLPLTTMNPSGLNLVNTSLVKMMPRGSTNIWAGIKAAMDTLSAPNGVAPRKKVAMLLTDGQPNISPPRGHITELRSYLDSKPDFRFQLNTFGFGYSLDSQLLLDLCVAGDGTFSFIPDALILGTTFVNSISNSLAIRVQKATLHLTPVGDAAVVGPVRGNFSVSEESWGHVVSLGPLPAGQSRDVVVPMSIPVGSAPYLEVVLEYMDSDGSSHSLKHVGSDREESADAAVAALRCRMVELGFAASQQTTSAGVKSFKANVSQLSDAIGAVLDNDDSSELLLAVKYDVEGRMSKALRGKPRFDRWGKHYLRALMRAHQLQLCTNFMDPGLQMYGGSLFKQLRLEGDKVFLALPAPVPSHATVNDAYYAGTSRRRAPVQMSSYYQGGGGGCFGESSTVVLELANSSTKRVQIKDVQKGDLIQVSGGKTAVVDCLVRIARDLQKPLVQLPNGPSITPGHPVRMKGAWLRPRDVAPEALVPHQGFVYNFVLDQNHVALVDGVECATWGHGFQDATVAHPFFGTSSIVKELQSSAGWQKGYVTVDGFFHDSSTGEAIGLKTVEETHRVDA